MTLVLLHSPLVGPATWRPAAESLRAAGQDAVVADPRDVQVDGPVVLVAHSNAGLYVPHLTERFDVVGAVYVDAALAPEAASSTPLAPPGLLEHLRKLTSPTGMLPPWSRWWSAEELAGLFPDDATRAAVESEQPELPFAYFTQRLPLPPGWAEQPAAYLAFGDTYADETARARIHGWPVEVLAGRHLHQLHDPDLVAATVLDLVSRMTR